MSGHGWVTPNADGSVARCGGPAICPDCQREAGTLSETRSEVQVERPLEPPGVTDLAERYLIAFDALLEIRNLNTAEWRPEAIKAHEALTRMGWRP